MSVVDQLEAAGWFLLRPQSTIRQQTYYRWESGVRIELHLNFDPIGRLVAWSEWHNVRASIDQEPGRRARLIERAVP